MRYAIIGGVLCRLRNDLTWVSEDSDLAQLLNVLTKQLMAEYGPALGFPRDYVFTEICNQLRATERNQPEPSSSQELVVY